MARFILGHRWRAVGARHGRAERLLYRLDRAFFGALLSIIRRLPVDAASRLGARIGGALGPRFKKAKALSENLRLAFPELSEDERRRIAHEAWANAGAVVAEYAHLEEIAASRIQVEVLGDLATLRDPAKPSIFVAPHQANWELCASAVVKLGIPLAVVYSPPTNPLLDELLTRWRCQIGCDLLPREDSMRPLIRALSAGRSIGMVMDRRVDSGRPVPLFGHEKPTTLVPARLALRYGCELVPVRVQRLRDAHFRVSIAAPVDTHGLAGGEVDQAVELTRRIHERFEEWIRAAPGQWFCSKRLWPKSAYTEAKRPGAPKVVRAA